MPRAGALGVHDVGGVHEAMATSLHFSETDSPVQFWEKKTHALTGLLCSKKLMTVDEVSGAFMEPYSHKHVAQPHAYPYPASCDRVSRRWTVTHTRAGATMTNGQAPSQKLA